MPINQLTAEGFGMLSGVASASFTGLLDEYPNAAAAYSVRRLSSTYEGALIRVREDSGDTEADIGFDANGNLDTAALLAHCGVNSGFVVTWYDQSGNTNNAQQTTASIQPQIVSSGEYFGFLQNPTVTNSGLNMDYNYLIQNYSAFFVIQNNGNSVFGGSLSGSSFYFTADLTGYSSFNGFLVNSQYSNGSLILNTRLAVYNATTLFSQASVLFQGIAETGKLGYTSSSFNNQRFKEFVLYPNQTVSRTDVENNQMTYYGLS
jgi:hypothetical protein